MCYGTACCAHKRVGVMQLFTERCGVQACRRIGGRWALVGVRRLRPILMRYGLRFVLVLYTSIAPR